MTGLRHERPGGLLHTRRAGWHHASLGRHTDPLQVIMDLGRDQYILFTLKFYTHILIYKLFYYTTILLIVPSPLHTVSIVNQIRNVTNIN
jgi:hypothetical protein